MEVRDFVDLRLLDAGLIRFRPSHPHPQTTLPPERTSRAMSKKHVPSKPPTVPDSQLPVPGIPPPVPYPLPADYSHFYNTQLKSTDEVYADLGNFIPVILYAFEPVFLKHPPKRGHFGLTIAHRHHTLANCFSPARVQSLKLGLSRVMHTTPSVGFPSGATVIGFFHPYEFSDRETYSPSKDLFDQFLHTLHGLGKLGIPHLGLGITYIRDDDIAPPGEIYLETTTGTQSITSYPSTDFLTLHPDTKASSWYWRVDVILPLVIHRYCYHYQVIGGVNIQGVYTCFRGARLQLA